MFIAAAPLAAAPAKVVGALEIGVRLYSHVIRDRFFHVFDSQRDI